MSEVESAPSSLLAGVTATNCFVPFGLQTFIGAWYSADGAILRPTTCYLLVALIPSWSRVQSLCFMGRFSATVTLWGCNERMKSKGVADNILTPKIHLRGAERQKPPL